MKEKNHEGQRQKIYVVTLQEMFTVDIGKLSEKLYNFVKGWEQEDLKIST